MQHLHFHEFHIPKGPNLWFVSVSAAWIFAIAVALFEVLTYMGGSEFSENMWGTMGLGFLLIGFVVSALLAYIERDAA